MIDLDKSSIFIDGFGLHFDIYKGCGCIGDHTIYCTGYHYKLYPNGNRTYTFQESHWGMTEGCFTTGSEYIIDSRRAREEFLNYYKEYEEECKKENIVYQEHDYPYCASCGSERIEVNDSSWCYDCRSYGTIIEI